LISAEKRRAYTALSVLGGKMKLYNAYDIYLILVTFFEFRLGDPEELTRSDLEQELDELIRRSRDAISKQ